MRYWPAGGAPPDALRQILLLSELLRFDDFVLNDLPVKRTDKSDGVSAKVSDALCFTCMNTDRDDTEKTSMTRIDSTAHDHTSMTAHIETPSKMHDNITDMNENEKISMTSNLHDTNQKISINESLHKDDTHQHGLREFDCKAPYKMKRYSFKLEHNKARNPKSAGPPPPTCLPRLLCASLPPTTSAEVANKLQVQTNQDNDDVAPMHDDAVEDPLVDTEHMEREELAVLQAIMNSSSMRDVDIRAAHCSTNSVLSGAKPPGCTLLSGGASTACAPRF